MYSIRASPRHYTVDPRLLPSGNPVKHHVEALSLQPMKQGVITAMFGDVLHSFCFVFALYIWFQCMAIDIISVQYNLGLLPGIITADYAN